MNKNGKEKSELKTTLRSRNITLETDLTELIATAHSNRKKAATDMNAVSSRSHCIFIAQVDRIRHRGTPAEQRRSSTVHLVDLAGSERLSRIGTDPDPAQQRLRVQESKATNSSLMVLNKCMKVRRELCVRVCMSVGLYASLSALFPCRCRGISTHASRYPPSPAS